MANPAPSPGVSPAGSPATKCAGSEIFPYVFSLGSNDFIDKILDCAWKQWAVIGCATCCLFICIVVIIVIISSVSQETPFEGMKVSDYVKMRVAGV